MRSDCRIFVFGRFGERGYRFFGFASEIQQGQHGRVAHADIAVMQRIN